METRQPIQQNSIIGDYLKDEHFLTDEDEHKYVTLWTTRFHAHVNNILRKYDYEHLAKHSVWCKKYVEKMLWYFKKYGVSKQDLLQKDVKTLYRGYDNRFVLTREIIDTGFIATSSCKKVAEKFACLDTRHLAGKVIAISVEEDLPSDVVVVIINEDIADHLNENEFLLLPGTLSFREKFNGNIMYSYKKNEDIEMFFQPRPISKTRKKSQMGGGDDFLSIPIEATTNICGMVVVWWRWIKNRPIQMINWIHLPADEEDIEYFMKNVVFKLDDEYLLHTQYLVPEYQDLKEKNMKRTPEEEELYASYAVHMAIYDPKKKKTLTLKYGLPTDCSGANNDEKIKEFIERECEVISQWVL